LVKIGNEIIFLEQLQQHYSASHRDFHRESCWDFRSWLCDLSETYWRHFLEFVIRNGNSIGVFAIVSAISGIEQQNQLGKIIGTMALTF
jgi:hypothetical protein